MSDIIAISKSANLQALHATIQPTRPGYRNTIWSSICDDSRHLHLKIVAFGAQIALRRGQELKSDVNRPYPTSEVAYTEFCTQFG